MNVKLDTSRVLATTQCGTVAEKKSHFSFMSDS